MLDLERATFFMYMSSKVSLLSLQRFSESRVLHVSAQAMPGVSPRATVLNEGLLSDTSRRRPAHLAQKINCKQFR